MPASNVIQALAPLASPENAARVSKFFKTGPGEYAHEDVFLGVPVPAQRKIALRFRDMPLEEVTRLLQSPIHEHRMTALLLWTAQARKGSMEQRAAISHAYRANLRWINNWDLVDVSASPLLGQFLRDNQLPVPESLMVSPVLWERRVAIVATHAWVRQGDAREALRLAEALLGDPEDLLHKAVGWTLREVGKHVSPAHLREFLHQHAARIPATALRAAIEHLPEPERRAWRQKRNSRS
jgi:3-methyladenine DNA glycosylase AlkD